MRSQMGIGGRYSVSKRASRKEQVMAEKGKSSKAGRKKKSGQNLAYINEQRHDKSHVRRLTRHLARFAGDKTGAATLAWYRGRLGKKAA